MKKLFAIVVAILFAATFSFAQNTLTSDQQGAGTAWQHSNINVLNMDQVGFNNSITINQKATTLYNEAFGSQSGSNLTATIDQTAGGYNILNRMLQSNTNGSIDLDQVAGSNNFADIWSQNGDNNLVKIDENATTGSNSARFTSYGSNFVFNVHQEGYTNNTVTGAGGKARQGNWGVNYTGNTVVGALPGQWGYSVIDDASPAYQKSNTSSNTLSIDQFDGGSNEVGLYQTAVGSNEASILQQGNTNSLSIYQINTSGGNVLTSSQVGTLNTSKIYQSTTSGLGPIDINQH